MDGSTVLKYFLSSKSTLSHGGLPRTQVKPPDQPVAGSTVGSVSPGTRKISGNSRCQWKKPYSDLSLAISVAVAGGIPAVPCSRSARKTRLTMAGGASLVLRQTNAAHQASATWWLCSFSGDCSQARYAAAWRCTSRSEPSGALADRGQLRGEVLVGLREDEAVAEELVLVRAVVGVGPAKRRSPLLVVALDGFERLVGDALARSARGWPRSARCRT